MESTANVIIESVKDAVNDEKLSFDKIRPSISNLHLSGTLKNFDNKSKIINEVKKLLSQIEKKENIKLDKLDFNTSGNVNYDYMQKIVGAIGCAGHISVETAKIKISMERAKQHRNKLAHGNWSFSNTGSNLVISTIEEDANVVLKYLEEVLLNLDNYLNKKKYIKY